ncbi:MAG: NAD-dependent epimerase/dehydratase family protein [Candidatus Aminicenantes bacterium]|nr:NAD-dependent epimerase/dehydratase family protein [Candidatus Aminicenantes bacterium]
MTGRSKTLLVTGANGFIGSNLCAHFLGRGHRVYGLVRRTADTHFLRGLPVRVLHGDLARPEEFRLPGDVEDVIHAASIVSDLADDDACRRNILGLAQSLVARVRADGLRLRRFVYVSTAIVLGYRRLNISPERPGLPADFMPYVRFKKATEAFLREEFERRAFPVVVLRPADVYGPNDRTSCLQIVKGMDEGKFPFVGHGRWRFPFCDISNLCQAAELALDAPGVEGRAYTVANGTAPTWREFFGGLLRELGRKPAYTVPAPVALALGSIAETAYRLYPHFDPIITRYRIRRITTHTTYDILPTVAELGYRPDDRLDVQVKAIVDWYRREKREGYVR